MFDCQRMLHKPKAAFFITYNCRPLTAVIVPDSQLKFNFWKIRYDEALLLAERALLYSLKREDENKS